jgi:hypothetical protein
MLATEQNLLLIEEQKVINFITIFFVVIYDLFLAKGKYQSSVIPAASLASLLKGCFNIARKYRGTISKNTCFASCQNFNLTLPKNNDYLTIFFT